MEIFKFLKHESMAFIQRDPDQKRNFKLFFMERVKYILEHPLMTVPLRTIAEQANLEFDQVESLWSTQVSKSRLNEKKNKLLNNVFLKDNFNLSRSLISAENKGITVKCQEMKGVYISTQICGICNKLLFDSISLPPCQAFLCGHIYHAGCLQDYNQCTVCSARVFLYPTEEEEDEGNTKKAPLKRDVTLVE